MIAADPMLWDGVKIVVVDLTVVREDGGKEASVGGVQTDRNACHEDVGKK